MSSNHTWVSRDDWSEMNRQIGSLNAYLINSDLQASLLRRQYEDRIQQIEDSYRANAQVVTQAVNALENAYRTTLGQAREQFEAEVDEHSAQFHQQLQELLENVGTVSGRLGQADSRLNGLAARYDAAFQALLARADGSKERAEQTVAELDRFLQALEQLNPERFRPAEYEALRSLRNLTNSNVENGDHAAALAVSQSSILTATRLLAQLTVDNEIYARQLQAAATELANLEDQTSRLASDAGVLVVELQGQRQEFDYDIEYWSGGTFGELRNRLVRLREQLETPDLSSARVADLRRQISQLQAELEQCDQQARRAMAGSVFVEETADRLNAVLTERGWEATVDEHHEQDARAPYTMEFEDGSGNTVCVVVSRGVQADQPIYSMEVYSDDAYRAGRIKDGVHAAMNGDQTHARVVERRDDCHLNPDPETFRQNMVAEACGRQ